MKFELLIYCTLVLLVGTCIGRLPRSDFWDQFPDMWRGMVPQPGIRAQDVQRQSRFEDWRNTQRSFDASSFLSGSRNIHDMIRDLFARTSAVTQDVDLRTAMMSLGAMGNILPQLGRGQFSFTSLFPEFQMPQAPRDWWNGPNVCVERKEENLLLNTTNPAATDNTTTDYGRDASEGPASGDNSIHINSCSHASDNEAYTCVTEITRTNFHRRYTVKYQCCYGFSREPGTTGCTKVIPMTNLVQTLLNLKLTALSKALVDASLQNVLNSGNYTIFAPTDEAFEEFQRPSNEINLGGKPSNGDLQKTLRSLIVSGLVRSGDFGDEEIVSSIANSTIRINLFSTPGHILTADCARVVSINNLATNGVVHVVDRVIPPVTKTLETALQDDGRFGTLLQLLEDAELIDLVRNPDGHVTILAPTNDAFRLMEHGVRNRLSTDSTCLKRVLQTHILPNVICSAVVDNMALTTNLLGKVIRFERDVDQLSVQNITILAADNMATNGMFYVLDSVIIPEEAKSLLQIANDASLNSFLTLVNNVKLGPTIDSLRNVTIFAPSNRAIERLSDDMKSRLQSSTKDLTDLLNYHIVQPAVMLSAFKDNIKMETALAGKTLRMNVFEAFPFGRNIITINCAKITVANLRGCDGAIHVLEKVLIPPTGDIVKILETTGNFTQLVNVLKLTGLDRTLKGEGPLTIFAPTDGAFAALAPEDLQQLMTNSSLLLSVLQLHILPRQVCCTGIMEDSLFFGQYSRSLNPSYSLPLRRNRYGSIHVAGSAVTKCDVIATNGVIHFVDQLIFPKGFL